MKYDSSTNAHHGRRVRIAMLPKKNTLNTTNLSNWRGNNFENIRESRPTGDGFTRHELGNCFPIIHGHVHGEFSPVLRLVGVGGNFLIDPLTFSDRYISGFRTGGDFVDSIVIEDIRPFVVVTFRKSKNSFEQQIRASYLKTTDNCSRTPVYVYIYTKK